MARRMRLARSRAGITRKQLAASSGASERYLAHLEAGTGNPSLEMLMSIVDALGIALTEVLPDGGEREPKVAQAANLLRRCSAQRLDAALTWLELGPGTAEGKAQRISLIGLRGAGKTTLGTALAERMGLPFFEISKEVEVRYGGTIAVLLDMNGPAAMHRYEAQVLDDICENHSDAVIAAPGAIVSNGALFEQLLRTTWSVWLEASPEDHMARVVRQGDLRPIAGNRSAMTDLRNILTAREAEYSRADARLDTSKQDFAATSEALERVAYSLIK